MAQRKPMNRSYRIKFGSILAAAAICLSLVIPIFFFHQVDGALSDRQKSQDRLASIKKVLELSIEAEASQREYVVHGEVGLLKPYHAALAGLPNQIRSLAQSYAKEDGMQPQPLLELQEQSERHMADLTDHVRNRQENGDSAQRAFPTSMAKTGHIDALRRTVSRINDAEIRRQRDIDEKIQTQGWTAVALSSCGALVAMAWLVFTSVKLTRSMRTVSELEKQSVRANRDAENESAKLRDFGSQISLLGEFSKLLQTEMTIAEAVQASCLFCQRLLPGTTGSVHVRRQPTDVFESAGGWGSGGPPVPSILNGCDCWAIRLGKAHADGEAADLHCNHFAGEHADGFRICLPLTAHGDVLGLMTIHGKAAKEMESALWVAEWVGQQAALAITHIKLRQNLRQQSIKELLTMIFHGR